jgi:hypothetical protein
LAGFLGKSWNNFLVSTPPAVETRADGGCLTLLLEVLPQEVDYLPVLVGQIDINGCSEC